MSSQERDHPHPGAHGVGDDLSKPPLVTGEELLVHICEVCGLKETVTARQAFEEGWDYPPTLGVFGVLSARTCSRCPITATLWWRLAVEHADPDTLSTNDLRSLQRIADEPASIRPPTAFSPAEAPQASE